MHAFAHASVVVGFHGAALVLGVFAGHLPAVVSTPPREVAARRTLLVEVTYAFLKPVEGVDMSAARVCGHACAPGQWRSNGVGIVPYNPRLDWRVLPVPLHQTLLANGIDPHGGVARWPDFTSRRRRPGADPTAYFRGAGNATQMQLRDKWLDHFVKHLRNATLGAQSIAVLGRIVEAALS